jgi:hypothetical protein
MGGYKATHMISMLLDRSNYWSNYVRELELHSFDGKDGQVDSFRCGFRRGREAAQRIKVHLEPVTYLAMQEKPCAHQKREGLERRGDDRGA